MCFFLPDDLSRAITIKLLISYITHVAIIEQVGSFQICCHSLIHDVERVAFPNYTGCKMWKFDTPLRKLKIQG